MIAFYDTKPYDQEYFERCKTPECNWIFNRFRLDTSTAGTAQGAQAVCIFVSDNVNRDCLGKLRECGVKLVALRCAGFNNVDLAAAKEFGIFVTRVPAYSPHAVAEHALALLLTLNRKIHRAFNRTRELNFSLSGLVGFDLFGKTAGIIGTGKIGKITGEILNGFGVKVLAYDTVPDNAWAQKFGARYVQMPELLAMSDIITLHAPLTRETYHIINCSTVAQMKQGAYLINTSRGKLVETAALIGGLKTGKLGGVGLDVYEEEDGVFHEDLSGQVLLDDELSRLLSFPNVLITSHQAFLTREALCEITAVTTQNFKRLAEGKEFLSGTVVS